LVGLVAVLVIGLLGRLLSEWQRRRTLVELVTKAPAGTVITQQRGRGGPAMKIEIGPDSKHDVSSGGGE